MSFLRLWLDLQSLLHSAQMLHGWSQDDLPEISWQYLEVESLKLSRCLS